MSFNIWRQGGNSLARCIDAIRDSGADIVGLQECNAATAQSIATSLGWQHLGAAGTSILSRYPIASVIPAGGSSGVAIELSPGQLVYLFNCHLPAYPYGPYDMREGQSRQFVLDQEEETRMVPLNQLLQVMAPYLATSAPCFLTGDFNAPSHLDYDDFPWPTSLAPYAAGMQDAYRDLHPNLRTYPPAFAFDDPGITWTPIVAEEPNDAFDRIDFVYFSTHDGVTPLEATELDGRNSSNPWPSDHRAVWVKFELTPPLPQSKATLPSPPDGAVQVDVHPTLSWLPAAMAESHDIYFASNPAVTFRTNQTAASFDPGPLDSGATYYWRIDEHTSNNRITGDLWSFTTRPFHYYEWRFIDGTLAPAVGSGSFAYADHATSTLTRFALTDGQTIPHMDGGTVHTLYAPGFTAPSNGYLVALTDSGPNGGGVYLNQFTLIWDLLIPPPLGWTPLFNTNPQNANDADFYIDPAGRVGIGAIGHSPSGVVKPNTWHRVAFVADLSRQTVRYHVDGQLVFTGSAPLDGRHSLYSNVDPGPDLLLFNEGDTSGVFTHAIYLSSFFCTDRPLSPQELESLGKPRQEGIAVGIRPIRLSMERVGSTLSLAWSGGGGYYQLQRSWSSLPWSWTDEGSATTDSTTWIDSKAEGAFYRVVAR